MGPIAVNFDMVLLYNEFVRILWKGRKMGFFGPSESQRREEQAKARRDQVVRDFGPAAARNILRSEDPDRYEFSEVADFDDSWD